VVMSWSQPRTARRQQTGNPLDDCLGCCCAQPPATAARWRGGCGSSPPPPAARAAGCSSWRWWGCTRCSRATSRTTPRTRRCCRPCREEEEQGRKGGEVVWGGENKLCAAQSEKGIVAGGICCSHCLQAARCSSRAAASPVEVAARDGHAALLHRLEPLLGVLVPEVVCACGRRGQGKRIRSEPAAGDTYLPALCCWSNAISIDTNAVGDHAQLSQGPQPEPASALPRTIGASGDKGAKLRVEAHRVDSVHIIAIPAQGRQLQESW